MSHHIMPSNRPTPTIEDYLAVMYVMERDGEEIIAARLAESLDVTPPTVTMTLKRMERDGWIELEKHKEIHLTPEGCEAASSVVRRHMLTEWMLRRMLKIPWSEIHNQAHTIEHSISDDVEDKLRENFEDQQLCPHGNPLPGYEYVTSGWVPLATFPEGAQVTIRRIHEVAEDDGGLLQFLENKGVVPGAKARIEQVLPFNQTITLSIGGHSVVLGTAAAGYIYGEAA